MSGYYVPFETHWSFFITYDWLTLHISSIQLISVPTFLNHMVHINFGVVQVARLNLRNIETLDVKRIPPTLNFLTLRHWQSTDHLSVKVLDHTKKDNMQRFNWSVQMPIKTLEPENADWMRLGGQRFEVPRRTSQAQRRDEHVQTMLLFQVLEATPNLLLRDFHSRWLDFAIWVMEGLNLSYKYKVYWVSAPECFWLIVKGGNRSRVLGRCPEPFSLLHGVWATLQRQSIPEKKSIKTGLVQESHWSWVSTHRQPNQVDFNKILDIGFSLVFCPRHHLEVASAIRGWKCLRFRCTLGSCLDDTTPQGPLKPQCLLSSHTPQTRSCVHHWPKYRRKILVCVHSVKEKQYN